MTKKKATEKRVYEKPRVEGTRKFETLAMSCSKTPAQDPDETGFCGGMMNLTSS